MAEKKKTYTEALLFTERCFHLYRIRIVIGDEPSISPNALCRARPLVNLLLSAPSRQCVVLERSIFTARASVFVTRAADMKETPTEEWNPKQYLLGRDARGHEILDSGCP